MLEGERSSGPRHPDRSDLPPSLHLRLSADVVEQLLQEQEDGHPPKLTIAWSGEKRDNAVSLCRGTVSPLTFKVLIQRIFSAEP